MTPDQVDQAVDWSRSALVPAADRDWTVPAGTLTWSCRQTAAHLAHDLLAYAGQVAGRARTGYLPMDLRVREAAGPREVLDVVGACGALLSTALRAADGSARAWHWGPTDPGGFAALGVNEVLVHGYDIAAGLGLGWRPPTNLVAGVLARLFPDAPDGPPADVLLWCTGRVALPGRPRLTSWVARAAVG